MPTLAVIALGTAANFLNQADRLIMPIAIIPMAEELNWSMLTRGYVLSSFFYGYITMQLPSGWLSSFLPPMRLLCVAVFGWSLCVVLTPSAARAGGMPLLFAVRLLMGIAEGCCLPAVFSIFSSRVPKAQRSKVCRKSPPS